MHHDALRQLMKINSDTIDPAQMKLAAEFFAEIMAAFEMSLRGYRESNARLVASNAELGKANATASAAIKELEGFSYSVSHDLRAPLRAVDGFSQILQSDYADKLDAEGQRIVNSVRNGIARMNLMIDDILAFSRSGTVELKSLPVDMAELVRRTLADELASVLAEGTTAIDIGDLPVAHGDKAMLRRVWMNLLDNATKYASGKPDARIEVGATDGDGETIYHVRDNGAGFEMQYAGKLFGMFQRLHGTEFPGTGIGLAIVKKIITRHGGRIWAAGKVGEGATFYFALPKGGSARMHQRAADAVR
jgi:light-regulated signal transduction histidine kinase (bacteriophytochrome)